MAQPARCICTSENVLGRCLGGRGTRRMEYFVGLALAKRDSAFFFFLNFVSRIYEMGLHRQQHTGLPYVSMGSETEHVNLNAFNDSVRCLRTKLTFSANNTQHSYIN